MDNVEQAGNVTRDLLGSGILIRAALVKAGTSARLIRGASVKFTRTHFFQIYFRPALTNLIIHTQ